ncbi:class I SAM-dependent methyltransferase [Pseudonocardia halophobica]|uniref:Transferase n=1 Tax=Pseudonocardia halophobica TaxID=29401 RepID=A0A9W6L359_9PSEU|nr:transferase [Pseudonocardia halophobica]
MNCRFCRHTTGEVILDAGRQPASDSFPLVSDPGPDVLHPLSLWLCGNCRLAQLVEDSTTAEEPRGQEPEALARQAEEAVGALSTAGFLTGARLMREFGSPHGGRWEDLLRGHGLQVAAAGEPADVVIDNIGMMHEPDQAAALRRRVESLAPDGTLFFQYHSFATILHRGQWNALRHGHFAYYSTSALIGMLRSVGLVPVTARQYPLYGGTVLLGATRAGAPDRSVEEIVQDEIRVGALDPQRARSLQLAYVTSSEALSTFLRRERDMGRQVVGYSAASRAVALLCRAGIGPDLLTMVGDASPAKEGRRMPGSGIAIVAPSTLIESRPDTVVLFVPDLLDEVRRSMPQIEAAGGRWVVAEDLAA